jgi:hypothetical protein
MDLKTTFVVDDLDGSAGAETVHFGFEGRRYEIDLSPQNSAALRDVLAPFISQARIAGSFKAPRPYAEYDTEAVRAWARGNGYSLPTNGRIPSRMLLAYDNR